MKNYFIICIVILMNCVGMAQEICGTEEVNRELMKKYPEFAKQTQEFNDELSQMIKKGYLKKNYKATDQIYEIPVVVHVFHDGSPIGTKYNKTDQEIQAWIDNTNKIYEGTAPGFDGPDNGGTRVPVRLVLAKRDMNCNATSGIVRIDGSQLPEYVNYGLKRSGDNGINESQLFSLSKWDPQYYYNIYIINKFDGNDASKGGLAGYAYYPGGNKDAAIMVSNIVKNNNTILSHEFGHAIGLKHTFGTASGNGGECPASTGDCTVDDDSVCDTEPSQSLLKTYPVPTNSDINPCTGKFYEGVQYNIMNYGYKLTRFTNGQSDRAVAHLIEYRGNLLKSKGGIAPDLTSKPNLVSACTPSSIMYPGNNKNMGPAKVNFGEIDYTSRGYLFDGNLFYVDNIAKCNLKGTHTELKVGVATPLSISVETNSQRVKAYIDYNNDGVFDENKEIVFNMQVEKNTTGTVNVTPPDGAILDTPLRLRIIADLYTVEVSPCYNPTYGQVEDFSVTLRSSASNEKLWQGIDSDWFNAANWSPGGVPDGTHSVKIPETPVIPILNGNAEVESIDFIGGEMKIDLNGHLKILGKTNK